MRQIELLACSVMLHWLLPELRLDGLTAHVLRRAHRYSVAVAAVTLACLLHVLLLLLRLRLRLRLRPWAPLLLLLLQLLLLKSKVARWCRHLCHLLRLRVSSCHCLRQRGHNLLAKIASALRHGHLVRCRWLNDQYTTTTAITIHTPITMCNLLRLSCPIIETDTTTRNSFPTASGPSLPVLLPSSAAALVAGDQCT